MAKKIKQFYYVGDEVSYKNEIWVVTQVDVHRWNIKYVFYLHYITLTNKNNPSNTIVKMFSTIPKDNVLPNESSLPIITPSTERLFK